MPLSQMLPPSELREGAEKVPPAPLSRDRFLAQGPPKTGFSIHSEWPVELRQIPAPLWTSVSRSVKCRRGITSISKSFRSWVKGPGGARCPLP